MSILIGAHPKIVVYIDDQIFNHYWSKDIEYYINESGLINPIIDTVDLLSGGTHVNDIFESIEFHQEHYQYYDIIFLPDCGGKWYVMQTLDQSNIYNSEEIIKMRENINKLSKEEQKYIIIEMIYNLYNMLKPNGTLVLSKFISENFTKLFIEILEEKQFVYYETLDNYNCNKVIVIKKILF